MFHSALLHALQWLHPKVPAKSAFPSTETQPYIRGSTKGVNEDKIFCLIEPFSCNEESKSVTVESTAKHEISSVDEQHKSLLAAQYVCPVKGLDSLVTKQSISD